MYFLPTPPSIPDLRTVRPSQWADDTTEASAEELRKANQINSNLLS